MSISIVKLTTGEEVITDLDLKEDTYIFKKAARIVETREGVGLIPYALYAKDEWLHIDKKFVLYIAQPHDDIAAGYNEQFGNGLTLPKQNLFLG